MTQTKLQDPDEVIARALFARRGFSAAEVDRGWPEMLPRVSEIKLALEAAGWAIVPVEATIAMQIAGNGVDGAFGDEPPVSAEVWDAMLAARPGR